MLFIAKHVLEEISAAFCRGTVEKGFLLGSGSALDHIDHCFNLPASDAGLHFYTPDPPCADKAIRRWAGADVCFCGMIHSHIVDKQALSENDVEFAKALYGAYRLPVLWFGIGIVHSSEVDFRFYSVSKTGDEIHIIPAEYQIHDGRKS